jgi:hypothetical protein
MKRKPNNPDAAKNLVFFKKGADANRNLAGRPKGKALSTILSELLSKSAGAKLTELAFVKKLTASMTPAQKKQLTTADIVVFRLLSEAIETGDITAIKEILDRTEGKAKQSLDITSNGEAIQAITQIEVVHTIKK